MSALTLGVFADLDVREGLTGQLDKAPVVQRLVHFETDVRDFVFVE